jgi:DNA-binding IscR family transcriptional regulator
MLSKAKYAIKALIALAEREDEEPSTRDGQAGD